MEVSEGAPQLIDDVEALGRRAAELEAANAELTRALRDKQAPPSDPFPSSALWKLAQVMLSNRSADRLAERCCETLVREIGHNAAWIVLFDEAHRPRELAQFGLDGSFADFARRLEQGAAPECVTRALDTSDIVLVKDAAAERGALFDHNASLYFDGDADNMRIPSGINLSGKAFTIEFWAKRAGDNEECFISQGTTSSQGIWIGFDAENKFTASLAGNTITTSAAYPVDGTWHHYAYVYDNVSGFTALYLDGDKLK